MDLTQSSVQHKHTCFSPVPWPCRPSQHGQVSRACCQSPKSAFSGQRVPSHRLSASARKNISAVISAASGQNLSVAISGATGLVGTRLVEQLLQQNAKVKILSRNPEKSRSKLRFPGVEFYDPSQWQDAMRGITGVINLAGEPIATRWNDRLKQEIKNSRVNMTNKLVAAINGLPKDQRPEVLVSASAVGYYGANETASLNESSPTGRDYLAEVCRDWEAAAEKAQTSRVVLVRTGIVLAKEGGALGKMMPVFQIFAGGPLGSGSQWCSWIHRDDLVNLYLEAVKNDRYNGVYNATAPNPVRMSELCSSLGTTLGRPSWLPVPDFALQAILGEGAQTVLEGQRVLPARAQDEGFSFQYGNVDAALKNIYNR